jgi:ABC-type oligopeptide transport system substrate-binding subunit
LGSGLLTLLCAVALSTQAWAQAPTAVPQRRIFRLAVAGPIRSLDPAQAESNGELKLVSNLTEPLLAVDTATGLLAPLAAKSFGVSDDGRLITFKLRDDLFFSNGERVRSGDFAYSLLRLLEPKTDSWVYPLLKSIRGADEYHEGAIMTSDQVGIRSPDPLTLKIELTQRDPWILQIFAQPATGPVHRKTIDRFRKDWTKAENWVGSGPFLPASSGRTLFVFQKNPHHRAGGSIRVDEVHAYLVASPQEAVDLYAQRSIDQFGYRDFDLPGSQLTQWAASKEIRYQPDLRTTFLRLNATKAALSKQKFRQALAMAIDRELLTQDVMSRHEIPAYSIVPPATKQYEPPTGYLHNEAGARIEFKELGYCTKGYAPKGCEKPPLLEFTYRDDPQTRKLALAIEAVWKNVLGIDRTRLNPRPPEDFARDVKDGKYLIALDDLAVEPERVFDLLRAFRSGKPTAGFFSNKTYDRFLNEAEEQADWNEAKKVYREAEAMLMREGGVIPLFFGTTVYLVSPIVAGYDPNVWDLHPFSKISVSR